MPAKSGKDAKSVVRGYSAFVGKMTGPKTQESMAMVLSIGISAAQYLAPVEYNTLANSAYRQIKKVGESGFVGIAGFSGGMTKDGFNYAYHLHESTNWKPRPVNKKQGPGWNPNAEPKFLEKGFTSPESKRSIQAALYKGYKI